MWDGGWATDSINPLLLNNMPKEELLLLLLEGGQAAAGGGFAAQAPHGAAPSQEPLGAAGYSPSVMSGYFPYPPPSMLVNYAPYTSFNHKSCQDTFILHNIHTFPTAHSMPIPPHKLTHLTLKAKLIKEHILKLRDLRTNVYKLGLICDCGS